MYLIVMLIFALSVHLPLIQGMEELERKEHVSEASKDKQSSSAQSIYFEDENIIKNKGFSYLGSIELSFKRGRFTCATFHPNNKTLMLGIQAEDEDNHSPNFFDLAAAGRPQLKKATKTFKSVTTSMACTSAGTTFILGQKTAPYRSRLHLCYDFNVTTYTWISAYGCFPEESSFYHALQFNHDGTALASAHDDGAVKIWDVAQGKSTHVPRAKAVVPTYALTYCGEQICFTNEDNGFTLQDPRSPAVTTVVELHKDVVSALAANTVKHLLISGSYDGSVRFSDIRKLSQPLCVYDHARSPVTTIAGHCYFAECIAGYHNGMLFFGNDLQQGACLQRGNRHRTMHRGRVNAVTLTNDREYWGASVGNDGTICCYSSKKNLCAMFQQFQQE